MSKLFPRMEDRPDTGIIIASLIVSAICFCAPAFFLPVLQAFLGNDASLLAGADIGFHLTTFLLAITLFRGFLQDSLLNFQIDTKACVAAATTCVGLILIYWVAMLGLYHTTGLEFADYAALSFPLCEMELFTLSCDVIYFHPLLGTLCMVLMAPFAVSCLFYAVGFAPVCCRRPWLAYVIVALLIAVPRLFNGLTYWNAHEEWMLYLGQLPVHLIACWGYQKTDTVWTPIVTLAIANGLFCLQYLLQMFVL